MEKYLLLMIAASLALFAFVVLVSRMMISSVMRRCASISAQGDKVTIVSLIKWRFRNGYAFFIPFASFLLRFDRINALVSTLCSIGTGMNVVSSQKTMLSVLIVGFLTIFCLAVVCTGNFLAGIALSICVGAILYVVIGGIRDKQREEARESIPAVLETMSACFDTGFTLVQTFKQIAEENSGAIGKLFEKCTHVLETGGTTSWALSELRNSKYSEDLSFVSIALDVQHQSGGSMKQVLDAASKSVNSELELRRSLRVQTAQAKLSARIVVAMPFILVGIFSLVSPGYLEPFFSSAFGYILLGVAILMQVAGIVLVNRALSVGGVS